MRLLELPMLYGFFFFHAAEGQRMDVLRSLLSACRLKDGPSKAATRWINDDLRPLPPSRRRWTGLTYLGWWSIWMMGLSNFQIGSSLVAMNMSVWQAMVAVIIGRIIIAAVAIGNGAVGSRWHIGFPVFSRIIWGMRVCIFIPSRSKTTTN